MSTRSVNRTILLSRQSQNFQKPLLIFPHLTRANHRQITQKNCRILHINRRWKLFSTHTVDLFKILVVNQRLKRRHGAPAFQTIFDEDVFGLVRDKQQFPSRRINFTPRTYFVRPKTFCCQQQSSQYPIISSQTRDQSFIRVAKWDRIREDVADFANRETCSFVRLNDAFRKALLKATTKKKTLRMPTKRAVFSLERGLTSNCHTQRIM